jgi:hypothetical protein
VILLLTGDQVMASRQGSADNLCGVYCVLNVTEVVIGKFKVEQKLKGKSGQKETLFRNLLGYLAKKMN